MAQKINDAPGILRTVPDAGTTPIEPKDGEENILITSALPYCNNVPHLGNIIGSLLSADVCSRYMRTRDRRTLYICGTDEYGTATETQALKEGLSPKALCDKYHVLHRQTYEWFELGFDYFGRTSTQLHTEICQGIYLNLGKHGHMEKQNKDQTYCEGCPKFLADRFVEGTCPHCGYDDARGDQCDQCSRTLDAIELINPRCLVDKTHKVVPKTSSHMYFKMQETQSRLEEWMRQASKEGKWSQNAVITADGRIQDARMKSGLRPTPLTRDLQWGVPVPVDEEDKDGMRGKVLYVWFDAPIGYPSITANYMPTLWEKWWFNPANVHLYQFMGKDNVYFHSILWPSVQLGDGRDWTKLWHLSTTEYLNYEGGKFSKSRNRGVFGPAAKETGIPASVWRFYLIANRPETADTMFSWADLVNHNNAILLNNFGNFVNRALKFTSSQYDSLIPTTADKPGPLDPSTLPSTDPDLAWLTKINSLIAKYTAEMDQVKLRSGLETLMAISSEGNTYLQSSGLNKALLTSQPERCATVISRALNLIWVLSALVEPFMPSIATSILEQLNAPKRVVPKDGMLSVDLLGGHKIGEPKHLFGKIEESKVEGWRERFGGAEGGTTAPVEAEVPAAGGAKLSKRKQAAAAKEKKGAAAAYEGPVTAEMTALESKIKEQGDLVRTLKTDKSEEAKAKVGDAVEELKKLKADLVTLQVEALKV
ncbi:tRNA synthetases class I (M)-domain-containing protein [Flagelloscypha sp. PMI_526]|nr:tRNA synthetases class I (M)-domain-containing protein [Flagelloscypha sp. PMI_526]